MKFEISESSFCKIERFRVINPDGRCRYYKTPFQVIRLGDAIWFMAKEVASFLEYSDITDELIRENVNENYIKSLDTFFRFFNGRTSSLEPTTLFINVDGFLELQSKSKISLNVEFNKIRYFDVSNNSGKRKEYVDKIIDEFRYISPIPSYLISNYQIDLYFPKQNIVVDFAYGHDPIFENKRQKQIEKSLTVYSYNDFTFGDPNGILSECTFLSYNINEPDFDVSIVINKLHELLKK